MNQPETLECAVGLHEACPRDTCMCTCHAPPPDPRYVHKGTQASVNTDKALGCALMLGSAVMMVLACVGLYTVVRWML